MYLHIINNIIVYTPTTMQHAGLFLYPRTRKLITSSLHMKKIRRAPAPPPAQRLECMPYVDAAGTPWFPERARQPTFLTPPPPPPKRRKSRSTKRVSWKVKEGVKVFNYWRRKHQDDIKLRSKKEIQSQKIHPLRSYPVINKIIWPLIIHHHINYWSRLPGGTRRDLAFLLPRKITMERLRADLRYIYMRFRQGKLAAVNFNKGLRLAGEIKIGEWNRLKKKYENYRTLVLSPLLRRFLINVMRDSDMAAISIQAAWRRHKAIKALARNTSTRAPPSSSPPSSVCSTSTTMR